MKPRSCSQFFSTNKSLWELITDTFNYVYERSPITFAFVTGIHHPAIRRLMGHPLLGRIPQIAKDADGFANLLESMAKLAVDENNPRGMAYCSLMTLPNVLITRPTDVAQILQFNQDKVFRAIPAMSEIFGHDNLFAIGKTDVWREKRNKLRRWILSPDALNELAPEMQKIIDEFSDHLKQNGEVSSLEDFLVTLTMNVFARTSMGSGPLGDHAHSIADGLGEAMDASSSPYNNLLAKAISSLEYLRTKLPNSIGNSLDGEKQKLKDILDENFFKPQLDKLKKSEGLLREYFDKHQDDNEAAMQEAYSDTALYLLAGQETTERLLQFTLLVLKRHPQILANLREEIEKHKPQDNQWTREILNDMHYLGKILKEVLRLYPPIPIIPRIASESLVLADIPLCHNQKEYEKAMANRDTSKDIIISAGTWLTISPWVTQRMQSLYPNPLDFVPERHQTDAINVNTGDNQSYAFFPFGAGLRDCPGRMFAFQEAKLALINFVQNFDLTTSIDDKPLESYIRGTLKVKGEVHASFRPRN